MPQIGKHGIPVYGPNEPFYFGGITVKDKPVTKVARALIVEELDGVPHVFLVYNEGDTTGDRPPGLGIPGGRVRVNDGETPLEALANHGLGEIPYRIIGEPKQLFVHRRDLSERFEDVHVFIVKIDQDNPCDITPGEALEVSADFTKTRFYSFEEALRTLPVAKTRDGAGDTPPKTPGIYKSHRNQLRVFLKKLGYQV